MTQSMTDLELYPISASDVKESFHEALSDFASAPVSALFFASIFVVFGLVISNITWVTETTYWLILAILGFPLIGSVASVGFYEISRLRAAGEKPTVALAWRDAWSSRTGQLPWLAVIIIVIFLFWFFLGHMIFALFLGLAPMRNVMSSLDVFTTPAGLQMLAFGTVIGGGFSVLVFGISVLGMPMIIDREVDFVTAMVKSLQAVLNQPLIYLSWGAFIGLATLISMLPFFLGLYVTMPLFGFMTWHIYRRATTGAAPVT
ncbi:MAG: DUF2189 domain-containing protein [Pseudomonadota bacterium]